MIMIKEWILDWFEDNTYISREKLSADSSLNYFDSGILDSFGFITLVTDIEDYYEIKLDAAHFQQESFFCIDGLSEVIYDLHQQKQEHAYEI